MGDFFHSSLSIYCCLFEKIVFSIQVFFVCLYYVLNFHFSFFHSFYHHFLFHSQLFQSNSFLHNLVMNQMMASSTQSICPYSFISVATQQNHLINLLEYVYRCLKSHYLTVRCLKLLEF